jgi:hypothetical protein
MSASKIEKYKAKFVEINKEYGIFTKELENFLGDDFYLAPASISLDMFNCYPGGLLVHLMTTAKYAVNINEQLPENIKVDKASLMKVVFLSQIGRTFMYSVSTNEWQAKNLGRMYEYNNDLMRVSVGERSIMYAIQNGVQLTDEEYQAILYSDKDDSEKMPRIFLAPISQIVRMGSQLAIMEEMNKKDGK